MQATLEGRPTATPAPRAPRASLPMIHPDPRGSVGCSSSSRTPLQPGRRRGAEEREHQPSCAGASAESPARGRQGQRRAVQAPLPTDEVSASPMRWEKRRIARHRRWRSMRCKMGTSERYAPRRASRITAPSCTPDSCARRPLRDTRPCVLPEKLESGEGEEKAEPSRRASRPRQSMKSTFVSRHQRSVAVPGCFLSNPPPMRRHGTIGGDPCRLASILPGTTPGRDETSKKWGGRRKGRSAVRSNTEGRLHSIPSTATNQSAAYD